MKYILFVFVLFFLELGFASENLCKKYLLNLNRNSNSVRILIDPKTEVPSFFFRAIGTSQEYIQRLRTYYGIHRQEIATFIAAKQAGASDKTAYELISMQDGDRNVLPLFVELKGMGISDEYAMKMAQYYNAHKDRIATFIAAKQAGASDQTAYQLHGLQYSDRNVLPLFVELKGMGISDEYAMIMAEYYNPHKDKIATFKRAKDAGASDKMALEVIHLMHLRHHQDSESVISSFVNLKLAGVSDEISIYMITYNTLDRINKFLGIISLGVPHEFAKQQVSSANYNPDTIDAYLTAKKVGASDGEAAIYATRFAPSQRPIELERLTLKYINKRAPR